MWFGGGLAVAVVGAVLDAASPLLFHLPLHLQLLYLNLHLLFLFLQILQVISIGLVLLLKEQELLLGHEWLPWFLCVDVVDERSEKARILYLLDDCECVHEFLAGDVGIALIGE